MKYMALIMLALVQVIIGLILSYKRRSKISKWFALFASTLAVWTLFNASLDYYQYQGSGSIQLLEYLNKLGFFWGILALVCVYRLTLVFPVEKASNRLTRAITGLGVLLAALSIPLEPISGSFHHEPGQDIAVYTYGALVPLVGLYSLVLIGLCIQNIAHVYKKSVDKSIKSQATLLFAGLILTVLLSISFITVIPAFYPEKESLIFVGYFAPFIFAASMFYSIFVQKFLDFRLVVARSMGYILSLTFLGIAYGFIAFYLIEDVIFSETLALDTPRRTAYTVLALIFGLSFSPAKRVFDKLSNRIFYRDAYDSQAFIDSLTTILVSNADIDEVIGESSEIINKTLKSRFTTFILSDREHEFVHVKDENIKAFTRQQINEIFASVSELSGSVFEVESSDSNMSKQLRRQLARKDVSLIIKLSNHGKIIGIMLIGDKQSGSAYTRNDRDIFQIVADELSLAIQNSLSYQEIKVFNKTLQEEIEDATKRLRSSNAKLKSLDETKDEFITMASHQLRTPLTSVKGYVSMVLEGDAGELNEQQKKLLNQAFISSQRMVYLIADLLNVSRLRTGRFIIETSSTFLPDVVQGELEQLTETAKAKGVELRFDKPAEFPELALDETKIRQVIMNFMDNAVHYTPAGGKIRVELEAHAHKIEFRVVDTGLGVPRAEQHKLFNKFFRADNARRVRPDGTGLGLFMAKKVVIAQGGALIFKSAPGKGSTFGFVFPLSPKNHSK